MLTEKQEEIIEAIWCAGEYKNYSIDAVKKRCVVDFTEADLAELEKKGMIVLTSDKILFSGDGKTRAETIIRRHRLAEVLVSSILRLKDSSMEKVACKVEHCLEPDRVFIKTMIRREVGATELGHLSGSYTNLQLVVNLLVMTFIIPCINATVVLFKERGIKVAVAICASVMVYAIVLGTIFNHACHFLGITFT